MFLVVGLGNPGREYASHRHNVGFMAIDELARRAKAESFREKFSGEYAKAEIAGEAAILLKPQTFMNLSGQCVQPAMAFFKIAVERVIVLHDELDVPFGEVRLKVGGGHAGHNGLRSLIASLGTPEFARVRIGVGRPPPTFRGEVADYVLSGFDLAERTVLPDLVARAAKVVTEVIRHGLAAAMKNANTRPRPPKPPKPAVTGAASGAEGLAIQPSTSSGPAPGTEALAIQPPATRPPPKSAG